MWVLESLFSSQKHASASKILLKKGLNSRIKQFINEAIITRKKSTQNEVRLRLLVLPLLVPAYIGLGFPGKKCKPATML